MENNNHAANISEQPLAAQMRQLQIGEENKCRHGFDPSVSTDDISQFMNGFYLSFREIRKCGGQLLPDCLIAARKVTMDKFATVWKDLAKMEMAARKLFFLTLITLLPMRLPLLPDISSNTSELS